MAVIKDLLVKIGYTSEMIKEYEGAVKKAGNCLKKYEEEYMSAETTLAGLIPVISDLETENISKYTLYLLFILDCVPFLWKKYQAWGISEDIFIESMKDILYKTKECMARYGVFGIEAFAWYEGFLSMRRFAMGRLQFDISKFDADAYGDKELEFCGITFKKGDPVLRCHIPSAGPLTYDSRLDAYKRAYEFHKNRLKDGILIIRCASWLFYPGYNELFGEGSNVNDFKKDFYMYGSSRAEAFNDFWRVFGVDSNCDISELPQNTGLQKRFVEYLSGENPTFGHGSGIIFFDGKKILTREDV